VSFTIRIEHALDVAVQRSHHADTGKHRWPVLFSHQEQRLHRGLPFGRLLFCFGQLGDVGPGVFERDEQIGVILKSPAVHCWFRRLA
jgi:hypothetical protein